MKLHRGSFIVGVLLIVALVLLPCINVAIASDIKVDVTVPDSVAQCSTFNIAIIVTNKTNSTISFNRIAVAYVLQDLKVRGPYQVDTSTHSVQANSSATFNVPFQINFGTGVVVPLTVILANGSYTKNNIIGGAVAGVKVN